MPFVIPYPAIDPVALELGPLVIRWYALAYLVGILLAWRYARTLAQYPPRLVGAEDIDDFVAWATLGVILGGRLGYVLFYKPGYYLAHPFEILHVWQGGMSFHGGLLGVIVAGVTYCHRRRLRTLAFADLMFVAAPIGLFLGRIANFINGELAGRPSSVPWAMVFPHYGDAPRHPSQLYQAGLEGVVLFVVLFLLWRVPAVRSRPGTLSGAFLVGYGLARITGELFREPDAHLGFILAHVTMGQILSTPMILAGVALILYARRRPAVGMAPSPGRRTP